MIRQTQSPQSARDERQPHPTTAKAKQVSRGDCERAERVRAASETGPILSIIITCYNYEDFVGQAIESVLGQACDDLEIIVVDDGSTDRSWDKIQYYATLYPELIRARHHGNVGALKSSLVGFSISKGAFVYFLDADDYLKSDAIGEILGTLSSEISKIQFMLTPIDKDGQSIGQAFPPLNASETSQSLIASIAARGHYVTPPTSGNIYRRDVYATVQAEAPELGYERAIDGVAFLLAPFLGQVVSIDKPLGSYRIHDTNLSGFSTVSAERMDGYANRFLNRLKHLDRILARQELRQSSAFAQSDYSYALEMKMMSKVASGDRIPIRELRSFLRASWQEYRGCRAMLAGGFGLLIAALPTRLARKLVEIRMNQSKFAKARTRLKKIFSAQRPNLRTWISPLPLSIY